MQNSHQHAATARVFHKHQLGDPADQKPPVL